MDVPLSEDGIAEAIDAGRRLKSIPLDVVYSSNMIRAQMTCLIALASHDQEQTPLLVRDNPDPNAQRGLRAHVKKMYFPSMTDEEETTGEQWEEVSRFIPVYCSNQLNERDFGQLQGMHSREQKRRYSAQQLEQWRCAWDVPFPGPSGESSKQVYDRVVAFFERHIRRQLEQGKNVMIVAHGFVQRVLIKHLLGISDEEWVEHMKREGSTDPKVKRTSKLLAQNGVPQLFSYTPAAERGQPAVVRIDTIMTGFRELFAVEDDGVYVDPSPSAAAAGAAGKKQAPPPSPSKKSEKGKAKL